MLCKIVRVRGRDATRSDATAVSTRIETEYTQVEAWLVTELHGCQDMSGDACSWSRAMQQTGEKDL